MSRLRITLARVSARAKVRVSARARVRARGRGRVVPLADDLGWVWG